jgi:hypothetical protein
MHVVTAKDDEEDAVAGPSQTPRRGDDRRKGGERRKGDDAQPRDPPQKDVDHMVEIGREGKITGLS